MKKIILTLLITFTITNVYATNQKPKSVDASNFDVAGIKLGMTFEQAETAIKSKMGANSNQFGITRVANIISGEKTVESFSVNDKNYFLIVDLTPSMQANNPATYVVWKVEYKLPNGSETTSNKQAVIDTASKKYGISSNSKEKDWKVWCKTPQNATTFAMHQSVKCDSSKEAVLEVSDGHILLKDFRPRAKLANYLEQKKKITPKF